MTEVYQQMQKRNHDTDNIRRHGIVLQIVGHQQNHGHMEHQNVDLHVKMIMSGEMENVY